MVVGDEREATDTVQALADLMPGMRGIYAGRLRNARQVENLTINLVSINRRYKAHAGDTIGARQGFGILFDDLVAALCTLIVIALWRM